jgi:hypothetical protein
LQIYAVAGVFFHPPLVYSEFLKRNDDALFIRVVGGGQTTTTACYFIFYRTPAIAEQFSGKSKRTFLTFIMDRKTRPRH